MLTMEIVRRNDYMNSQIEKCTNDKLSKAWKDLIRKCKRGDVSAIRRLFEIKGMLKRQ